MHGRLGEVKRLLRSFNGTIYRGLTPQYYSQPYCGEGAKITGGRYNSKGTSALYCTFDIITPAKELPELGVTQMEPHTLVSFELRTRKLIDLRVPNIRKRLPFRKSGRQCAWCHYSYEHFDMNTPSKDDFDELPPSQKVYFNCVFAGADGIIAPVAYKNPDRNEANIILFNWNRGQDTRITLFDTGDTLKHDPDAGLPIFDRRVYRTACQKWL